MDDLRSPSPSEIFQTYQLTKCFKQLQEILVREILVRENIQGIWLELKTNYGVVGHDSRGNPEGLRAAFGGSKDVNVPSKSDIEKNQVQFFSTVQAVFFNPEDFGFYHMNIPFLQDLRQFLHI